MIRRDIGARCMLRVCSAVAAALLVVSGAAAQVWTGSVDSNWNTPGNWNPVGVPGAGASVTITNGTPNIPAASSITIGSLSMSNGTLTIAGSLSVSGTVSLSGGSIAGSGTGTITWATITSNSSSSTLVGPLAVNNGLTMSSGTLRISGAVTFSGAASLSNCTIGWLGGGTMNFGGDVVATSASLGVISTGAATYTLTVPSGRTVRLRSSSNLGQFVLVGGGTSELVNNGTIVVDGATGSTINPQSMTNNGSIGADGAGVVGSIGAATAWTGGVGSIIFANNGGRINLNGTFNGAALNGMTRSPANSGIIAVTGACANTGNTLTLNATTGDLTLDAGSIAGGTVAQSGGSLKFSSSTSNRLIAPITVNGALVMTGGSVRLAGDVTFGAAVSLSANATIAVEGGSTLSVPAGVTADGSSTIGIRSIGGGSQTLTIAAGTTVRLRGASNIGAFSQIAGGTSDLINNGTITADGGTASTCSIDPMGLTNNGVIGATGAGNVLHIGSTTSTWSGSPASQIFVNNTARVNLRGSFTGASIAGLTRSPANTGVAAVVGACNNTGNTLTLNATTGDLTIDGGSITGGTLTQSGGSLLLSTSTTNRLVGPMTFNGDAVWPSGSITLSGAVNFSGDVTMTGGQLAVEGTGSFSIAGGDLTLINTNAGIRSTGSDTYTLTIPAGLNVHLRSTSSLGQFIFVGGGTAAMVNNGTIIAELPAATNTINPSQFTNNGTLRADGSGAVLSLSGSLPWTNNGTLSAFNGGRVNIAGTCTRAAGWAITRSPANSGTIAITGTLVNTGFDLALNATTGDVRMESGHIQGGQISPGAGSLIINNSSSNRWTDLTYNGNLDMPSGASLTFAGSITVTGTGSLNSASLAVENGATFAFQGAQLLLTNSANFGIRSTGAGTQTMTIPAGLTVTGRSNSTIGSFVFVGGGTANVVNNGTIISDTAASLLTLSPGILTNNGTLTANTGNLTVSSQCTQFDNPGTINVGGTGRFIINATNWTSAGAINVSGSGRLDMGGNVVRTGIAGINRTTPGTNTIAVTGAMNNAGGTITLNAANGNWLLDGGAITGGAINQTAGAALQFSANTANRLNGPMTISGDMTLGSGSLTISGTVNFSGIGTVAAGNLAFENDSGPSFGGGTLTLTGGSMGVRSGGGGTYTMTIPSGLTVIGRSSAALGGFVFTGGGTSATVNNGTILCDQASAFSMSMNQFTNNGLVHASAGTLVFNTNTASLTNSASGTLKASSTGVLTNGAAAWTNAGAFSLENGGRINLGGAFSGSSIGTISRSPANTGVLAVTGACANTGNTLTLAGSTGDLLLDGGSVTGGTIVTGAGGALTYSSNNSNRLIGPMTFTGDLVMNGSSLTLRGTVAFSGNANLGAGSSLAFEQGGQPSFAGGTVSMVTSGLGIRSDATEGQTLTIPAGLTVKGSGTLGAFVFTGGGSTVLVNNGVISSDIPSGALTLSPGTLTNTGTIQSVAPNNSVLSISGSTVVTNYNAATNTLTGGSWILNSQNGSFNWPTIPAAFVIRTIAPGTTVILGGLNSSSGAVFNTLTNVNGTFGVLNRRVFISTPVGGVLTNAGTVMVGTGGLFNITGDYTQTAAGALLDQVGGTGSNEFGRIVATGTANLNGAFTVQYVNGFGTNRCVTVQAVSAATINANIPQGSMNLPVKTSPLRNGVRVINGVTWVYYSSYPADIADDQGNPGPNGATNEGDYNAFFLGYFDAAPHCDIADDQGTLLNDPERDPLVPNSGVNEGDYNAFFQYFFAAC